MALRASVGETRWSASRRWISSTLLSRNRLPSSRAITAPAPATPAVPAHAGRHRRRREHAQGGATLECGGNPADGIDGQPTDEQRRHAREAEGHDTIAPAWRVASDNRDRRRLARRDALGALGRDDS